MVFSSNVQVSHQRENTQEVQHIFVVLGREVVFPQGGSRGTVSSDTGVDRQQTVSQRVQRSQTVGDTTCMGWTHTHTHTQSHLSY